MQHLRRFSAIRVCGKRREQTIILIACKDTSAASMVAKCEIERIRLGFAGFGREGAIGLPTRVLDWRTYLVRALASRSASISEPCQKLVASRQARDR